MQFHLWTFVQHIVLACDMQPFLYAYMYKWMHDVLAWSTHIDVTRRWYISFKCKQSSTCIIVVLLIRNILAQFYYYLESHVISISGHKGAMIWAATWQNQQNECAPSEDSDQPLHPSSLIRVFAVQSMGS